MSTNNRRRPVRLPLRYAVVLAELLADVEDTTGQLPLLEGEQIGHRHLTPTERLALDDLHDQINRALRTEHAQ